MFFFMSLIERKTYSSIERRFSVHSPIYYFVVGLPVLIDFSLTVKAATLIFIPGRGSTVLSARHRKSRFIYNLVKN